MSNLAAILPVILSGGSGTRLWPASRESYPKQLLPLVSPRSMIVETALRAPAAAGFAAPIVVCNETHRFIIAEQLREAGVEGCRIVLEPAGRNSAPAIAAAALLAAESDPMTVLWMMAADAVVDDVSALHASVAVAARAARAGRIATFGIAPTRAETGYGWIARGEPVPEAEGCFAVARFIEKPDAATARALLEAGGMFWNSGMFVFTAETLLSELERHAPEVLRAVRAAVAERRADLDFLRLGSSFAEAPAISLDYAVAERTDRAVVVPCGFGWSDVGSWAALWELAVRDAAGNAAIGNVLLEGCSGCYVRSDGPLVAATGLADTVVVAEEDAVLVVPRARAQEVRRIVDRLKAAGRREAAEHRRIYRPWGFYEGLIAGERFQVKRIVVQPGRRLSLQKHYHRAEHWVVVNGTALVTRDNEQILLRENDSVYLPLGCVHRLENPGKIPLALIEVQSGAYLGEDDIVRLEDVYGRA